MDKFEFFKILEKLDPNETYGFDYNGNCTDPMTSRYWVSHMANYELTLHNSDWSKSFIIESKKTSRPHYELKEALIKKYQRWCIEFRDFGWTKYWKRKYNLTNPITKK